MPMGIMVMCVPTLFPFYSMFTTWFPALTEVDHDSLVTDDSLSLAMIDELSLEDSELYEPTALLPPRYN
jgi:hypothetical protein